MIFTEEYLVEEIDIYDNYFSAWNAKKDKIYYFSLKYLKDSRKVGCFINIMHLGKYILRIRESGKDIFTSTIIEGTVIENSGYGKYTIDCRTSRYYLFVPEEKDVLAIGDFVQISVVHHKSSIYKIKEVNLVNVIR